MTRLASADRVCVVQRNPVTGCVPAAAEWLLRYLDTRGIDLDAVQENFDLAARGLGGNNFSSVPGAIVAAVPGVAEFGHRSFPIGDGWRKICFCRLLLRHGYPCALALIVQRVAFHAVPIVTISARTIECRWMNHCRNRDQTVMLSTRLVAQWHDDKTLNGGRDIMWAQPAGTQKIVL